MIVHLEYPGLGTIPIPGLPIKLSLTPARIDSPAPRLGEQNEEVYGKLLGISVEQLHRLKEKGII
jgi:crotonobetainyl-CoA:carnitine CoA-transferase CaiB-like acyl-CoA transferase